MSILSALAGNYADDIAKGAAKTAASKVDDIARLVANNSDDIARLAENKSDGLAKAASKSALSPEQAEFFKGSKLRDKNGNLIKVYHTTPNKFEVFDDSSLGKNTFYGNTKFGHFVTPDKDFSARFSNIDNIGGRDAGNVMEMYANIEKPIIHPYGASDKYTDLDELDKIVKDYFKATDNQEGLDYLLEDLYDQFGDNVKPGDLYDEYMMQAYTDFDPFDLADEERKILQGKGYDAVEFVEGLKKNVVDNSLDETPISSYAVFSSPQLKSIANKKPTKNPNIYLSLAGLLGGGSILSSLLSNNQGKES